MAYQKKYYFTFRQMHTDNLNTVELWQDTAGVLTAEEVTGMASPFITEINEVDHKFQPVIGQGCEVSMLSKTDRKFLDGLYHVDPKEFIVKHYIGATLNFIGYLNSEMYMEDYSSDVNYGTSITGNDGLALADRYTFVDESEAHYEGILSEWDILIICLNRIGLEWDELRTSISTVFADFSGDIDKTVLHETYVDASNFYDEDDYPMTIREVLESILQPYGAQLFCDGGNVYIVDVEARTKGVESGFITSTIFKRYIYSTEAYIGDLGIALNNSVQNIGYSGTGQAIELSGGVNKQVVAYSPYPTRVVLEQALVDENEFSTVPESFIARQDYFYKILAGNKYIQINVAEAIAAFESSYYDGTVNGVDYFQETLGYIRYGYNAAYADITNLITKPIVNISSKQAVIQDDGSSGVAVSLKFDVLQTWFDSQVYRYIIKGEGGQRTALRLYYKLRIGDWYYDGDTATWVQDNTKLGFIQIDDYRQEQWISIDELIPVGIPTEDTIYSGEFDFSISSKITTGIPIAFVDLIEFVDYTDSVYGRPCMVWLKNLNIDIVNQNSSEIPDDDVEYIGTLDDRFKNEGKKIVLTTGTDVYASDKAKLTWKDGVDYKSISEWTRSGQTYKIEELLLNSICSNYRFGFYKLDNMVLRQGFSILNVLTDDNIADKVFMIKSAKFDYDMNQVEVSLWETSPDNLTIVKV